MLAGVEDDAGGRRPGVQDSQGQETLKTTNLEFRPRGPGRRAGVMTGVCSGPGAVHQDITWIQDPGRKEVGTTNMNYDSTRCRHRRG